jgi:hypothetical protein
VGEIGYVSWQYSLLNNHLALDGSTISDASQDYPELLAFFSDNNLMAATSADYADNKALCYYDSGTDELTMPDFLDKTVWGGSTISEKEAGLPNITGGLNGILSGYYNTSIIKSYGALDAVDINNGQTLSVSNQSERRTYGYETFDASRSNSIYGNSTTVQPPAIQLIPQIRYKKDTITGVEYSTEERKIGAWIDGKPLYQRVIVFNGATNLSPNTWNELPTSVTVSNIDIIIKSTILSGDINLPCELNYMSVMYDKTQNKFKWLHERSISINIADPSYIILQYTKTTD